MQQSPYMQEQDREPKINSPGEARLLLGMAGRDCQRNGLRW